MPLSLAKRSGITAAVQSVLFMAILKSMNSTPLRLHCQNEIEGIGGFPKRKIRAV
jgi:hypothetical protein